MRTVLPLTLNLIYKTLTSIKRGLRGRQPMRRMLPQRRWECCTSAGGGFKCSNCRDKKSGDNSGAKHAGGARTPWIASKDSSSFSLEVFNAFVEKGRAKILFRHIHFYNNHNIPKIQQSHFLYLKELRVVFSESLKSVSVVFLDGVVIHPKNCHSVMF